MTARRPIPASFFGAPVGILGLAGAWRTGARIWGLPSHVADGIAVVGALTWAVLIVLYAEKWLRYRSVARQEALDPIQSSFVSLIWISTMLVSIAAIQVSRSAGALLFGISVVCQLALGAWLLGRMWQGVYGPDFATPALYLPGVGQNFVAAAGAAAYGWPQIGSWLFGCGLITWFATESVVLGRAATRAPLPSGSRPAMGVQLAPPVVGGVAYLGLTSGVPDMGAHILFGYGLFQAALLVRLWPWIRQPSFSPGYWAFSFGATALPTMAMRMLERGDSGPMSWAAPALFAAANLMIAYLGVSSLWLLVHGGPQKVPAVPAEQEPAPAGSTPPL
jgi:tellurite resistance protein